MAPDNSQISNSEIWRLTFLAVAIAAVSAVVILRIWDEWFALVLAGYGLLFLGGYIWLPWRGRMGYAISVGLLFGLLAPLLVRMLRH